MPFLSPNQQRQSTTKSDKIIDVYKYLLKSFESVTGKMVRFFRYSVYIVSGAVMLWFWSYTLEPYVHRVQSARFVLLLYASQSLSVDYSTLFHHSLPHPKHTPSLFWSLTILSSGTIYKIS